MQKYNKKLLLTLYLNRQKTASIDELNSYAKLNLGIDNKKYIYSAYLYPLLKRGIISRIRRGLYSINELELNKIEPKFINPFHLASKLRNPYYFGYSTALQMHGSASILFRNIIVSVEQGKKFSPLKLESKYIISSTQETNFRHGLIKHRYHGKDIIISSKARTIIETINKPHFVGGWEEVIRSLDILCYKVSKKDEEEIVQLLKIMGNKTLTAKVGYILNLFVNNGCLDLLDETLVTIKKIIQDSYPFYLFSRNDSTKLEYNKDWNLYVPHDFQNRFFSDQRI